MSFVKLMRLLRAAIDELHVALSNAALDHTMQWMKDTPATADNAQRMTDAVAEACRLMSLARTHVDVAPTEKKRVALARAERRLRGVAEEFQFAFPETLPTTGDSHDGHTIH